MDKSIQLFLLSLWYIAFLMVFTIVGILLTPNSTCLHSIGVKYNIADFPTNNIQVIRPYDALKTIYGDKIDFAFEKAFSFKNRTEMTYIKDSFYKSFPVFYIDQGIINACNKKGKFVAYFDSVVLMGYCSTVEMTGHNYCVIFTPNLTTKQINEVLMHELTHAAQKMERHTFIIDIDQIDFDLLCVYDRDDVEYWLDDLEFVVRVAAMKRTYFQRTGVIITDREEAEKAFSDFKSQSDKYDSDSQELFDLMRALEAIPKHRDVIIEKIIEFLPQVVNLNQKIINIA